MTLIEAVMRGSFEEFTQFYEPGMATNWESNDGKTLLSMAIGASGQRIKISNLLLDDGADASEILPDGRNYLHLLLRDVSFNSQQINHVDELAALVERLLEGGADINAVAPSEGTPIQSYIGTANYIIQEQVAIPLYEVLFTRPELDLPKIGTLNRSTYSSIWQLYGAKIMLQYAQHQMLRHDIEIPNLQPMKAPKVISQWNPPYE